MCSTPDNRWPPDKRLTFVKALSPNPPDLLENNLIKETGAQTVRKSLSEPD